MNRMEQGIASIPRQTMIRDQPHMLAYITPAEAMLLKQNGGSGLPSHGGVPEFGLWSSTFGRGNSFDQSMQNTFGGNDGGSFVDGEWQGDERTTTGKNPVTYEAPAPTRTTQYDGYDFDGNKVDAGTVTNIQGPTSFFNSLQNRPIEGWAAYHGGINSAANSSDNDGAMSQGRYAAQPMYQAPAPVNVAPPTLDPISSGQPTVPPLNDQTATNVTNPSDVIARPPAMPIGQRPANKAYTFQELLGMYQNPYA